MKKENGEPKKESNFKTAFKEMMGNQSPDSEKQPFEKGNNFSKPDSEVKKSSESKSPDFADPDEDIAESNEESVIATDMVVEGNITSKSKVMVLGRIKGNLKSKNDITISGKLDGDISGRNVSLNDCPIKGNITASDKLSLNEKTALTGNVDAGEVISEGKIEGNVRASKVVELTATSTIIGDIVAGSIRIHENAIIRGMVDVSPDATKEKGADVKK